MTKMTVAITLGIFTALNFWGASLAQPATPVKVVEVQEKEVTERIKAIGTLIAKESINLTSNVSEIVTAIHFEEGQNVKAGDLLVEMTNQEEHAMLAEAKSTLQEALQQLERVKPLVSQGAASQALLDERKRNYQNAQANLKVVESRLADRIITAPFDGRIGLRQVSVGTLINPGTSIATLDDISMMKLDFNVPSRFLSHLTEGLKVQAKTIAFPNSVFNGLVKTINTRVDPISRMVMVRAHVDNPETKLKPGLLMNAEIMLETRKALMVPEMGLVLRGEKSYVFIAEKGENLSAKQVEVTTGFRADGEVEIISGIKPGDLLITHGNLKVRDKSNVKILKDPQASNEAQKPAADSPGEEG